jgi:hypothetical protein
VISSGPFAIRGTGLDIAGGNFTALPDPARMLNQELYCRDYIVVLLGLQAEVDAQSIRDGIERELRDTSFVGLPTKVIVVAVDDPSRRIAFTDGFTTVQSVQPDGQNVVVEACLVPLPYSEACTSCSVMVSLASQTGTGRG